MSIQHPYHICKIKSVDIRDRQNTVTFTLSSYKGTYQNVNVRYKQDLIMQVQKNLITSKELATIICGLIDTKS